MNDDIILAAYHADVDLLKKCIMEKHDVNAKDDSGYTPLHRVAFLGAVGNKRLEMAHLLIDAGADVNSVLPNEGPSVLSTACQAGNYGIVKILVTNGADINFNGDGSTPLIEAIQCGSLKIISYLLERGADYNIPNAFGQYPIDVAEDYERQDIVELLTKFANKH